jgi:hypothetical protein
MALTVNAGHVQQDQLTVHLTTPSSFMIFEVDVDGLSCVLVGAVLVLVAMIVERESAE